MTSPIHGRLARLHPKFWNASLLALLWAWSSHEPLRAADLPEVPVVDCHVHLWDTARPEGITWIAKDNTVLNRSFLPAQHEPAAKAVGVKAVVIVQAGQSLPDNQWNLDVTAHNPALYRGVVGNLSKVIGTDAFSPLFDSLCRDKRYVGYRLSGRYQPTLTEALYRDLQRTADQGRTLDVLAGDYSLDDVAEIARRVPTLKIMLNHCGNVQLGDKPLDPVWVGKVKALAAFPQVHCKISALFGRTKTQPAPRELAYYQPLLDLVFTSFGEDRVVFGSDWPVSETSGDYAAVLRLTQAYVRTKGRPVADKLFHANAARFYGIADVQPDR
jgi:L-fuconolactonase